MGIPSRRQDVLPEIFFEMAYWMANHSCEELLPEIRVPVLIVAGSKDTFTPVWASEKMLREIPDAEMLYIKEGSHAGIVEHPELINLRFEKFLRDHFEDEFLRASVAKAGA